jgi:hypothetical protein
MARPFTIEVDVQDRIMEILGKFVNQKFNGITITVVKRQYDVDGRYADIAVPKDDGLPILLIETKKEYYKRRGRGFSVRGKPFHTHI